jgi:hypothetical protein
MITELKQYWTAKNPNRQRTTFIVIHHAAAIYRPGTAIQSIWTYHKNKWPAYGGIAYHLVCQEETDRSIKCYVTNPPDMQGAGVAQRNHETFHICLASNFLNSIPDERWISAAQEAVTYARTRYPNAHVVGHRDIALPAYPTTCPGNTWAQWKNYLMTQLPQPPVAPNTTPIKGAQTIPYDKLLSILQSRTIPNPECIASAYTTLGNLTGIGNVYPVAQALITSSNFSSLLAQMNNPAHVGTNKFETLEEGVLAQYAHLLAYATVPRDNTPMQEQITALTPRYDAVVKAYGRGQNKAWQQLSGKWSNNPTYGQSIVALGNTFL